jgi:hypothetical protein
MGRPRKEGMDYFPHDVDALADEKIEAMRTMFGNDGYAFYFISLERIYRSESAELDLSSKIFLLSLANKVMVKEDVLKAMIDASIEFGLFDAESYNERNVLTSNGIKKRFLQINSMRDKWRGSKSEDNDSFLDGKLGFSTGKSAQSKVKESKANKKESKENKTLYGACVYLLESEYKSLVETYGPAFADDCIKKLDVYKASSGKQYESDYHAMHSWVIKRVIEDINKPAPAPKPTYSPPATTKPKMQMATQDNTQYGINDEELQEMLANARKLDEGSSDE